jgi:hypothetical protein
MRFFYWMFFGFLFLSSLALNLKSVAAAPKYGYTTLTSKGKKPTVKAVPKKIIVKVPLEEDESGLKVLVIKKTEIKSLVDSIKKNYKSYTNINRYERVGKVPPGVNQDRLKLTRDDEQAIASTEKPLILGGKGFGALGFEAITQGLHFSFDSHIKESPIYKVQKENRSGYVDFNFKEVQSEKFLIFHDSGSIFGREPDILVDPKPKQFAKQQEGTIKKVEPIPETGVYFDQNKNVIVHLNPAEKPLDLIRDNSALLRHDYQKLISGDSLR